MVCGVGTCAKVSVAGSKSEAAKLLVKEADVDPSTTGTVDRWSGGRCVAVLLVCCPEAFQPVAKVDSWVSFQLDS